MEGSRLYHGPKSSPLPVTATFVRCLCNASYQRDRVYFPTSGVRTWPWDFLDQQNEAAVLGGQFWILYVSSFCVKFVQTLGEVQPGLASWSQNRHDKHMEQGFLSYSAAIKLGLELNPSWVTDPLRSSAQTADLHQPTDIWAITINNCCFKPLTVRVVCYAIIGNWYREQSHIRMPSAWHIAAGE